MNFNDKIVFTGKRPDVKSFLSLADVFVLPTLSKGEGSPVSLLEAMASGVITLGSRIPGIRDQLAGFEELMFEAGNARELAEKIKWVMELSGSERNKITKRLMKNVTDNYTIEREVKDHENMYMSLISVG
jgi:glycosyltransferase involved in cell wall biosynthesis